MGSSNNPISGVTVCVVLVTALLLRIYLHRDGIGPPATIYGESVILFLPLPLFLPFVKDWLWSRLQTFVALWVEWWGGTPLVC